MRLKLLTLSILLCITSEKAHPQSPISQAKENVLLQMDFDDPANPMVPNIIHGDTATAVVQNGHYVLNTQKANRFWALRLGTPAEYVPTCNILEMKMKVVTDSPQAKYGILWNSVQKTPGTFNEFDFWVYSTGQYIIFAKANDSIHKISEFTECPCINKGTSAYNTLRIEEIHSGEFRFFINGQMVHQAVLRVPQFTTFGFYSDAHTALYVDYIKFAARAD
ncbi:hypothetical protein [Chitinophaga flava]|uniref:Uncharacterized protein n=1 Tax=Chitinophaga flava TaxID=2259036 RepID=A0A365XV77_9BACT|nr:hypothetical protein [Chitinophaga flava]RBL90060.1 hypothetical protein DF182_26680 [Chitinophaga flava]